MKTYSGFTANTANSLLLDAGAFFKNFDVATDTFASAVAAGKLIGATKDGGEFSAVPTIRQVEVDGVKGRAKGLEIVDGWEVYIKANVLEVSKDALILGLCAAEEEAVTLLTNDYAHINGKADIELTDYIDNITWVGTLSGSNNPVIIQVKNALNTDGLKLTTKDKDQSVVAMTFYGQYTYSDLETPPFDIYYPDEP